MEHRRDDVGPARPLDGAAAFAGRTKAVTDPADQVLLTHLRSHADVVLVGSATVAAERYGPVRLAAELRERRLAAGQAELPRLAIVTARGALSPELRVFSGDIRPLVVTTEWTVPENWLSVGEGGGSVALDRRILTWRSEGTVTAASGTVGSPATFPSWTTDPAVANPASPGGLWAFSTPAG